MKKCIAVMLITLLTVASVFAVANFDKSNLSINYKPVGYHGQLGVSYAYNKAEFGLEVWSMNSILMIPHELIATGSKFVKEIGSDWPKVLLNSIIPSEIYGSAVYEILRTEKSELSAGVGVMVGIPIIYNENIAYHGPYDNYSMFNISDRLSYTGLCGRYIDVCGELEYAYHFDANNALTVRLVLPVHTLLTRDDYNDGIQKTFIGNVIGYSGIGYRYTF